MFHIRNFLRVYHTVTTKLVGKKKRLHLLLCCTSLFDFVLVCQGASLCVCVLAYAFLYYWFSFCEASRLKKKTRVFHLLVEVEVYQ